MVIRKNARYEPQKRDLWFLCIMKHWVFILNTALGLSICLPVCYCIWGILASTMLNIASCQISAGLKTKPHSWGRVWKEKHNETIRFFSSSQMKYLQWNKVYQGREFNIYSEVQFIAVENVNKISGIKVQHLCLS